MEFPVVEYRNFLWLVIYIDGDDNTTCITKDGNVDTIGMASCSLTMNEALTKEGFKIVGYQTIKEFLDAQLQ